MLLDTLNDEFVAGHIGLSTAVTFASARARLIGRCSFQSMQFLKTNISRGSVATFWRDDGIGNDRLFANFLLSVPVKKMKIGNVFSEDMDKRVWYLVF